MNYAGRIAGVVGLLLVLLSATVLASHDDLKITGFLDRTSAKPGEAIVLETKIVNDGKDALVLSRLEPIPRFQASCTNVNGTVLPPHSTASAVCTFSPVSEGNFNVGATAYWHANSTNAAEMSAAYNLTQLTVLPHQKSFTDQNVWILALISIGCVVLVSLRRFSAYQVFYGLFVLFGLALVAAGLERNVPTFSIAGFVAALSGAALLQVGKEGFRKFLNRLVKAGPVEFAPNTTGSRALKISKIREQEFIRLETTPQQIIESESRINYYLALLRLQAYALEARFIDFCPQLPPSKFADRESWLDVVRYRYPNNLTEAAYRNLMEVYRNYARTEAFKNIFETSITNFLNENLARQRDHKNIYDAIKTMESCRAKILSPQYYVNLARLNLILDRRERALAMLYEGYDLFPENLKSIVFLADHLAILNTDFTTASAYGMKAVEIVENQQREMAAWQLSIDAVLKRDTASLWTQYLKTAIEQEAAGWKECAGWLRKLEVQLKNNVAYYISAGSLYEYAAKAEAFARSITATETLNHNYLDTIGFVKLRFADYESRFPDEERIKKDLKEACYLFSQAAKLARRNNDVDAAETAELHYEQAARRLDALS